MSGRKRHSTGSEFSMNDGLVNADGTHERFPQIPVRVNYVGPPLNAIARLCRPNSCCESG